MAKNFTILEEEISYNEQGLVPVVVQDAQTDEVLMLAWQNREALEKTIETNQMHYHSRSRQKLWFKGETSGQIQDVVELVLDCDNDTILAKVNQKGVACHTGRKSCFFKTMRDGKLEINQDPIVSPDELYNKDD